jgi:bifunctional NMN adenylyltransferase/nudix hydrolase
MKLKEDLDVSKYDIGVIIGRFQLHELHKAHCDVIESVMSNHKKVILFLGVTQVIGSSSNPLDFASRKAMIQEKYPQLIILALPDKRSNEEWSKNLDTRIREVFQIGTPLLYGSRDSFIPHYKGQFSTAELEQEIYISGTEVRKQISEEIKSSKEWRAGVIYSNYNKYPISYQTVDVAVFNEDDTRLLLAKKPGEDKYRFIGGFVDPRDKSIEQAAIREFHEEAGGAEISITEYIGSFRVDDWRYRGERDKIMTILYKAKYIFGHLEPSDDVSELRFFDKSDFDKPDFIKNYIMDEHQGMMSILLTKLNKK